MFTDGNPRHQRAGSLGFSYFDPYNENYSLGASSHSLLTDVSLDDDTTWDLFNTQSPQCIGQDQTAPGAIRTPHDDLCAHPPKCPTASHFGGSGGHNPSHMLFHTRHFDPQAMSSSTLHQQPASGPPQASMLGSLVDYDSGTLFLQTMTSTPGPSTSIFSSEDFGEQLSALSSPPTRNCAREGEEDRESVCDSDCDVGTICHDTVCSEDPSACCEDESCLQSSLSPHDDAITSEDAIAAAALAAIGDQQRMAATTGASSTSSLTPSLHAPHHGHSHSMSAASVASCLPFGTGPDLCISPQFLMNFRHFQEVHNPLNPAVCTEPACPVEDPTFYQECHIRHFTHNANDGHGGGMFDSIDLDMMMSENGTHDHKGAVECGARFPDSHSMFEHMLNEHGTSLSMFQNPVMQHSLGLGQTYATATPTTPPVNIVQQGVADSSSYSDQLSLSDPFRFNETAGNRAHNSPHTGPIVVPVMEKNETAMENQLFKVEPTQVNASVSTVAAEHVNDEPEGHHECLWCSHRGGEPCKQVFGSAGDLHTHVLDAHTHQLKRGADGMFSCGWQGCTRREGEEKSGFLQKSKVDRHMQVHTGNKPFTCDICNQSFSANQALIQHKLIHEDSKPLKCNICGKTFRQHSALTMHIRTHTKVRPLKCPYCSKEFSESSNLSKHKRIHTGDGQYLCKHPGCGRAFHRRDQLRRHSTQHCKAPSSFGRVEKSSLSLSPSPE
ncbi:zinc finger protein 664 [Ophiostoma piceae UAMH 11346]|uniref:Zinc finger protein 664 n=1 Tax=Ophiostoma piceae (strain UAMH 11346) TaxID=1262450 RepID=S3BTG2_OPHP1|nr:zinc finger protein 664 [Ophiostoma piceae UAMH 11346]